MSSAPGSLGRERPNLRAPSQTEIEGGRHVARARERNDEDLLHRKLVDVASGMLLDALREATEILVRADGERRARGFGVELERELVRCAPARRAQDPAGARGMLVRGALGGGAPGAPGAGEVDPRGEEALVVAQVVRAGEVNVKRGIERDGGIAAHDSFAQNLADARVQR